MTDPNPTTVDSSPEVVAEPGAEPRDEGRTGAGPLVEADLLVEEVSIDGMCGVY